MKFATEIIPHEPTLYLKIDVNNDRAYLLGSKTGEFKGESWIIFEVDRTKAVRLNESGCRNLDLKIMEPR
jgi:hypothetical protein